MNREHAIQQAVAAYQQLHSQGSSLSVAQFLQRHLELQPELEQALIASSIQTSNESVRGRTVIIEQSPPTSQCLTRGDVQAWINKTLSPDSRAVLDQHLLECDRCRAEIEEQEHIDESLKLALKSLSAAQNVHQVPQVPNHQCIKKIAQGGQGEVWLAKHTSLYEQRAIKIIPYQSESIALRLVETEVRALSKLPRQENRAVVHDLIKEEGRFVMIMEWIEGRSLSDILADQQRISWKTACNIGLKIAKTLNEVHDAGILHRDIKPANIILNETSGRVVLADFGLAVIQSEVQDRVGTSGYLAPEIRFSKASVQTDLFALGATLFHLIVGQPPFDANDPVLNLKQALAGITEIPVALQSCPPPLRDAIRTALHPDPQRRSSLSELAESLRQALAYPLVQSLTQRPQLQSHPLWIQASRASAKEPTLEPIEMQRAGDAALNRLLVNTGDVLRFDIKTVTPGYLTILVRSEQGAFHTLFPETAQQENTISPLSPRHLILRMTPPAGCEWLLFLWSCDQTVWNQAVLEQKVEELAGLQSLRSVELLDEGSSQMDGTWSTELCLIEHIEPQTPNSPPSTTLGLRGLTDDFSFEDSPEPTPATRFITHFPYSLNLFAPPSVHHSEDVELCLTWSEQFPQQSTAAPLTPCQFLCTSSIDQSTLLLSVPFGSGELRTQQLTVQHQETNKNVALNLLATVGPENWPTAMSQIEVPVVRAPALVRYAAIEQSLNWIRVKCVYVIALPGHQSELDWLASAKLEWLSLTGAFEVLDPAVRWERNLPAKMENAELILIFDSPELWNSPWAIEEIYEALRIHHSTQQVVQIHRRGANHPNRQAFPPNLRRIANLPAVTLLGGAPSTESHGDGG